MQEREADAIREELSPPLDLRSPEQLTSQFVFSSPHSGNIYPRAFLKAARLDAMTLRKSEDAFVDELFIKMPDLGAPLLAARFPRAYLDVNREPFELDPVLFRERLPDYANTQSVRVIGGLGTIARIVTEKEEIYRKPLTLPAALARIEHLYRPYHDALTDLLNTARSKFGSAVLIDCHSMPSAHHGSDDARPDIVIGDRFGTSCAMPIVQFAESAFRDLGFDVSLNRPYAGGFITEHYGRPAQAVHALQIEINRALYMDERNFSKLESFAEVQSKITSACNWLLDEIPGHLQPLQAAE